MTTTDLERIYSALNELYEQLPGIECRGKCYTACRPIDMSKAEHDRIQERTGIDIPTFAESRAGLAPGEQPAPCPALGPLHQCKVYEVRPFICRAWGVTESMRCPHGCVPEGGRWLTDDETMMMLMQTNVIGDSDFDRDEKDVLEVVTDPRVRPLYTRFSEGDRSVQQELGVAMEMVMKEKRIGRHRPRRR